MIKYRKFSCLWITCHIQLCISHSSVLHLYLYSRTRFLVSIEISSIIINMSPQTVIGHYIHSGNSVPRIVLEGFHDIFIFLFRIEHHNYRVYVIISVASWANWISRFSKTTILIWFVTWIVTANYRNNRVNYIRCRVGQRWWSLTNILNLLVYVGRKCSREKKNQCSSICSVL